MINKEVKSIFAGYKPPVIICLGVPILAFAAVIIFRIPISNLLFTGSILICPLLHIWLMKRGGHKH